MKIAFLIWSYYSMQKPQAYELTGYTTLVKNHLFMYIYQIIYEKQVTNKINK